MEARLPSESPRSEIRSYGANPGYYLLVWGVLGPLAVWALINPPLTFFIAPIILASLFFLNWWVYRLKIEITPGGIRVIVPLQTVETAWANLESVRLAGSQSGFITHYPIDSAGARMAAALADPSRLDAPAQGFVKEFTGVAATLVSERRFIPLRGFRWHLWHSDFVAQVDRYAPQVELGKTRGTSGGGTSHPIFWRVLIGFPLVILFIILLKMLLIAMGLIPNVW